MVKTICFPFIGTTVGGAHLSHLNILNNLEPARYKGVLAVHDPSGLLRQYLDQRNIEYALIPLLILPKTIKDFHPGNWLSIYRAISRIRKFLLQNKIHIVQAADGVERILWQIASLTTRTPYLHTQRTKVGNRYSLEKLISYRLMSYIVSNSKTTQHSLPPMATKKRSVIYPAVNFPDERPDRKAARTLWLEKLALPQDAVIVSFLANFQNQKRPLFFVDVALSLLKKNLPFNVYFLMAGNDYGAFSEKMSKAFEQAGYAEKLKLCPFVQDPLDYLAASDIMVAPAKDEAFGRALIESMYSGTPVIASDHSGHTEIITEPAVGTLVDPDDVDAFCDAIQFFLENPEAAQQVSDNAYSHILNHFGKTLQAQKFMDVYDIILKKNNLNFFP